MNQEQTVTSHMPDQKTGIARQRDAYRAAVLKHIDPGQPCCIAGFPDHNNSGDAAIYLGGMALFDEIGSSLAYVCTKDNYRRDIDAYYPDGPIFILGGGTFGDLYGENWLRLRALDHYRNRKIVQLPQSIHFQRPESVEQMAKAITAHRDFHLMVRDISSFDFATEHFDCPVTLVPDAAYYLGRIDPSGPATRDILSIQRTDKERTSDEMSSYLASLGPIRDWRGRTAPLSHYLWVVRKHIRTRFTSQPAREAADMRFRGAAYLKRAQDRLDIAVNVLSGARAIISDRLHGHIISSLLRKPHVALDNTYGKVSSYIDTWGNDGLSLTAKNVDELQSAVEYLVSDTPISLNPGRSWSFKDGEMSYTHQSTYKA